MATCCPRPTGSSCAKPGARTPASRSTAEGDAFFVAFAAAPDALAACGRRAGRRSAPTRGRTGSSCGFGWACTPASHRASARTGTGGARTCIMGARVASAAHGGQVLVSATTSALADGLELGVAGRHRLKDFLTAARAGSALGPGPHRPPRSLDSLRDLPSPPSALLRPRPRRSGELVGLPSRRGTGW